MGVIMDKRDEVIADLIVILNTVKECEINDLDKDLFGRYYDFTSGDMLDICMELRKKYKLNLNQFIHSVDEYTINNMADALCRILDI
jgi:acyl carrier protein